MINGTSPIEGKQVYDIMSGYGRIISVEPDESFVVEFSKKSKLRFSSGGYLGNQRRIYWDNPIVVEPTATDKNWQVFLSVARQIYNLIKEIKG